MAGSSEDPVPAGRQPSQYTREPPPPEPYWRVAQYADTIENAWSDSERSRMLIFDLPRRFHQSSLDRQEYALQEPPRLTGTNWDSLLAATTGHMAITHDHPVPDWCDEPERSLNIYWMPLPVIEKGFPGMVYRAPRSLPAAWRHDR